MRNDFYLLFISLLLSARLSSAAPLGTIPTVEERNWRINADFRTDLWTSPYKYKDAPLRIFNGSLRVPMAGGESWKASLDFEGEAVSLGRHDFGLGKKEVFLGNNLRSAGAGLGIKKDFNGGSSLSAFASYASASDNPYGENRNIWIESTVIYYGEKVENHRWVLAVNQSNNRGFENGRPFPFGGVLYEPNRDFSALFGFPFLRLMWGRTGEVKQTFNLTPFGVRYDFEESLPDMFVFNVFAAFTVRSYLHESRIDENDRLYYQEWAVETSLRKNVSHHTGVIFGLGYSFDRSLYESETLYAPNSPTVRLESDIYGRVAVEFRL